MARTLLFLILIMIGLALVRWLVKDVSKAVFRALGLSKDGEDRGASRTDPKPSASSAAGAKSANRLVRDPVSGTYIDERTAFKDTIDGEPFRKRQDTTFLPPGTIELERHLFVDRHAAVRAYGAANDLYGAGPYTSDARVGLISAGKSQADLQQALLDMGLDGQTLLRLGSIPWRPKASGALRAVWKKSSSSRKSAPSSKARSATACTA